MGVGKSGEIIDMKKLKIKIGSYTVAENGKFLIVMMKKN